MTLVITHKKVSPQPSGNDATRIYGPDWNADHVLTGPADASQLNANVVQSVVNDTNIQGSIATQSLMFSWAGTLAAGRLNSNVVQGITNDTNVTGTISAQNLTLGWTGTLAAARLNSNVVQAVTDDTNVTGSISAQSLTLGWTGTLALSRLAQGANGQLIVGQTSASPAWTSISGAISLSANGGTALAAPAFGNPSAFIGLTANNGSAMTAMRSDASPPISQSIAPTWTGAHTFSNGTSPVTLSNGGPGLFYISSDSTGYYTGMAQGGSSTTITLAATANYQNGRALATNDSSIVNATVHITSGTGSGQVKKITAFNNATNVATISGTFSPAPDATSVYSIGRIDYGYHRIILDKNGQYFEVWEALDPTNLSETPYTQQDEWLRFNRQIHVTSMNYPLTGNGNRTFSIAANYVWDNEAAQIPQTLKFQSLSAATNTLIDAINIVPNNATPRVSFPSGIYGSQTNDSAAAGYVGEFIESIIASGSAVALVAGVVSNVTSISVPAGDWDISGTACFTGGTTTTATYLEGSISTTTASVSTTAGEFSITPCFNSTPFSQADVAFAVGKVRKSFASTTTVYLTAKSSFGMSTCNAYGTIKARRVR